MKEWLRTGTMIGPYRIVMRIGVSAIGEVYQVRDEVNFRDCALKLLSGTLGWDHASQQRFVTIVKSAPALDHPNINGILDVNVTENGRPYVITEIVHGRTLDEIGIGLARKLYDKIQIAIQIAEALEFAHQKHILHVGLKPTNVMIEHTGQVRVLDFAVTLATQVAVMSRGAKAPQRLTIGVARYLSPEQVRGEKPTPQSDIFSLGTIVYELLSSQLPFPGRSVEEVTNNILNTEPAPLTLETHEVPPSVNPVLMKALAKDPAARYRTAGEFAKALQELAVEAKAADLANAKGKSKRDEEEGTPKFKDLLDLLRDFFKKWKKKLLMLLFFKVIALAAFFAWRHYHEKAGFSLPEEPLPFSKITTSGKVLDAVISPNGQHLVYLIEESGRHDLLYKELTPKARERVLFSTRDQELGGLTFNLDNEYVYCLKTAPAPSALYKLSIRGGGVQQLLEGIAGPVTISPNNFNLALVRQTGPESQLIIADPKARTERVVATQHSPAQFAASGPAWSHDGKTIVCAVKSAAHDLTLDLVSYDVATGAPKLLATGDWTEIGRLAWLAGDEALLVNGRALPATQWQIWRVNAASGKSQALTVGVNDFRGLSLTSDTKRAVTVNFARDAGVWLGTNDQANELISGHDEGLSGLVWLNNEQLIYTSRANRREELWQAPAGVGKAQLLKTLHPKDASAALSPVVSVDGKSLLYIVVKDGQTNLWQANVADFSAKQITNDKLNLFPNLGVDGSFVLFSALLDGKATLAKLNLATDTASLLLKQQAWGAALSPDGTQVACNVFDETSGTWKVIVIAVTGGPAKKTFALPGNEPRLLRWTPDGLGLAYIITKRGVSNLWQQPLASGDPAPLTSFTRHRLYNFAWSPSGKQLAVARGRLSSDAMNVTNLK